MLPTPEIKSSRKAVYRVEAHVANGEIPTAPMPAPAIPSEPQYTEAGGYQTHDDWVNALRSLKYQEDEAYRAEVQDRLRVSPDWNAEYAARIAPRVAAPVVPQSSVQPFRSNAELVAAMRDPLYSSHLGEAYRRDVAARLRATPEGLV